MSSVSLLTACAAFAFSGVRWVDAGDGLLHAQELAASPRYTRYFAEGATGFFDTSLAILNLSTTATANVTITLLAEGVGVIPHQVTLAPRQRQTVAINAIPGAVAAGAVSIVIDSDVPIAADRTMTWGDSGIGMTLDSGSDAPGTTWYFAEGATGPFLLYYLLQNPGTAPATVTVKYLVEGASAVTKQYVLAPQSRRTVFVNEEDAALATTSVGAIITADQPVLAERSMYVNANGTFGGGASAAGVSHLSTDWYFGEGATGPFFEAFLALANPHATAATATVMYHMSDGSTGSKAYEIPAEGRRTIYLNGESTADPALAALANGPVWFTVSSTQPIASERVMWWSSWPWYEGHAAAGSIVAGTSWAVPEGRHGGAAYDRTYVLIGNTSANAGHVRLTLIPDTGATATRDVAIPADQRLTLDIGELFSLPAEGARFSVIVDSLGAGETPGVPVAVDYARYRSVNGVPFSGGGAAAAILMPPPVPDEQPAPNQPPSFVAGADQHAFDSAGPQTVVNWATAISAGAPGESAQTLTFIITGNTNPALFDSAPAVSPSGTLTFTPAAHTDGTATIALVLKDDGGTEDGGVDTSPAQHFTITIAHLNEGPVLGNTTITYGTPGNTQLHVGGATRAGVASVTDVGGVLAKANATDSDGGPEPLSVVPYTGPTPHGRIALNADGTFTYVPDVGYAGTDVHTFQVTDGNVTVAGTMDITVDSQRILYVNNAVSGDNPTGGDGRSSDAFETIAAAEAASLPDDIIFVFAGNTASTPLTDGIVLKSGQKLLGEGVGLTLPGFGTLVPAGSKPRISSTGQTVFVWANEDDGNRTGIVIRGFELASSAFRPIDVRAEDDAALEVEIGNNTIAGSGSNIDGISIGVATTAPATLSIHDNTITAQRNGLNVLSNGPGILTIKALDDNVVTGDSGGGISILGDVTFDSMPGGALDVVDGGVTVIGSAINGVGGRGLLMDAMTGDLSFTSLQVHADNGAALDVMGTAVFSGAAGARISAASGGATLRAVGGAAIYLTTLTVDIQAATINSTNALRGAVIAGSTGTFSASNGSSISNTSLYGFVLSGGDVNVTYGGTITSDVGGLVDIQSMTGGNKVFAGAITDGGDGDGAGIVILGNSGGTTLFTGGLTLSTGANDAFRAVSGGTVGVCDEQPCDPGATGSVVNHITTTTGTALLVTNSTIGMHGLEFRSISASGGAFGIRLQNTGTLGGLSVKGTGAANSGGVIQNLTGDAISLNGTSHVSLAHLRVTFIYARAIAGSDVHGFSLTDSTILRLGGLTTIDAIAFGRESAPTALGVDGTVLIRDVVINGSGVGGGGDAGVRIVNGADASVLNMTMQRLSVWYSGEYFDGAGVSLRINDGLAHVLIDDADFMEIEGRGVRAYVGDASPGEGAELHLTIQDSSFTNHWVDHAAGVVDVVTDGDALGRVLIAASTIDGGYIPSYSGTGIRMIARGVSELDATVRDNVITAIGDSYSGIEITGESEPTVRLDVRNNVVTLAGTSQNGMAFRTYDVDAIGGLGRMYLTLGGNTIDGMDVQAPGKAGFLLHVGESANTYQSTMYLNVATAHGAGNNVVNGVNGVQGDRDFRVGINSASNIFATDYVGATTDAAGFRSFVHTNNSGGNFGAGDFNDIEIENGGNWDTRFSGSGPPALPVTPTLP